MEQSYEDTLKTSIINNLGDNYNGEDSVIEDFIKDYSIIASSESNRSQDDELLAPLIKKAVVSAYLSRGKEGTSSSSEGGLSDSYIDIENKLRADARTVRLFVL